MYLFSSSLVNDLALCNAMVDTGKKFRIVLGRKKIAEIHDSKIYHNLSHLFNESKEDDDQSKAVVSFQESALSRSNTLVPHQRDSKYWENKLFMYRQFVKLDIPHPKSVLVDSNGTIPEVNELQFPLLFKPAHSCASKGIEKLDSREQFEELLETTQYREFILQEWIDMRRDLRLIYIGDELVVHYWRINNKSEWKPTSTSHGSTVDFNSLPDKWMPFIFDQYKKLGLTTGAFDITWRNDDLSTKPLFLEVSPSYLPNPAPVGKFSNLPYSEFKKCLFGRDAHYKHYADLVYATKKQLINAYEAKVNTIGN